MHKRLLREPDLTLEKALQAGQAAEETRRQTIALATTETDIEQVDAIHHKYRQKKGVAKIRLSDHKHAISKSASQPYRYIHTCKFCAGSHDRGKCPAYNKACNKCHHKGHFAKVCRSKKSINKLDANVTSESHGEPDDCDLFLGMIKARDPKNDFKKSSCEPAVTQKETHLHVNTIKSLDCYIRSYWQ